jgi:hypothetical protein
MSIGPRLAKPFAVRRRSPADRPDGACRLARRVTTWPNEHRRLRRQIPSEVLSGGGEDHVPFAGQSVGLIHDIRPAGDIIRDTIEEAERIIGSVMPEPVQH